MPPPGRSADDLPLAAYTTGVDPETEPAFDERVATAASAGNAPGGPDAAAAPMFEAVPASWALPGVASHSDAPADGQAVAAAADRPAFRELLRNPRANARDPRLLLSGVIGIGVVLLALSLLGGGSKGPAVADASPTAPAVVFASTAPAGDASVELTGALKGTFALTGVTGLGRSSEAAIDSSWGDPLGDLLALGGSLSSGTRTTDATLTLSWTVMVSGKPVTFASTAGECTVGMAVKPASISGSFVCHKVKSVDGKYVVGASGTYRT